MLVCWFELKFLQFLTCLTKNISEFLTTFENRKIIIVRPVLCIFFLKDHFVPFNKYSHVREASFFQPTALLLKGVLGKLILMLKFDPFAGVRDH